MVKYLLIAGAATFLLSPIASQAEPTPEFMVQEAAGLLHHSCDSLVEVTGGHEDTIVSAVRKMIAVSLINRQIDLSGYATSDEQREELRLAFIEEVRDGCAADRKTVLIGIVDQAVKTVLDLK